MKTKEEKKKSNLGFMLLVILLISVILCISSFGIATWARYRSVTGSNVEAQIAKWSFKVNGEEEQFADINLADTIAFTNVEKTTIAPGTYGSFDLEIDASGSEVSLDYYIKINLTSKPTNLKLYSDSLFQNELEVINNKIELEDEILLADIDIPVVKTIYWKWDYRTNTMPSETVLNTYLGEIDGLQTLINEYNEVGKTAEQKQEIAAKINDKIDTHEQCGDVVLEVSVRGVQKHPSGFELKGAYITNSKSVSYDIGDTIGITVEYSDNVYADENQTAITEQTAPKVEVETESITTSNNEVIKVASLSNMNLNLAEGMGKYATFVSASGNKINYEYQIKVGDINSIKIKDVTGNVYNEEGNAVFYQKEKVKRDVVNLSNVLKISNVQDMVNFRDSVNLGNSYEGITVKLLNNIDLSSVCSELLGSWTPIGTENLPCVVNFDGNGKTISGLYITGTENGVGLFGGLNNSSVQNLLLEGEIVSSYSKVGLLAGTVTNCTINNIVINNESSVTGVNNIGGVVGLANKTTFNRIINNGNVTGNLYVGGIVGQGGKSANVCSITESGNEGDIVAKAIVGGISGLNLQIQRCYNKGNIRGTTADSGGYTNSGGIQGAWGKVYDSYNCGAVYGASGQVAGITGNGYQCGNKHIQRCYNVGTISGSGRAIGSIVGENKDSTVDKCFFTSSQNACGYRGSATNTSKVTDEEIKTSGFGANNLGECWTDDGIGNSSINNGYPILRWQIQ